MPHDDVTGDYRPGPEARREQAAARAAVHIELYLDDPRERWQLVDAARDLAEALAVPPLRDKPGVSDRR